MTDKSFQEGYLALVAAFPGLQFNSNLFSAALNDLDSEFFLRAVWKIVKETTEIYPGTNIIAMLRFYAEEFRLEALKTKTLKLIAETEAERIDRWKNESVPMPEECREALLKLGVRVLLTKGD